MTILVDSDILIEVARARNSDLVSKWMDISRSEMPVVFSPVSAAELWAGARPAEYDTLERLFQALKCIPADNAVGRRAGEYLRQYRTSHGVELGDALIAAGAVVAGALLWTRNRKHYPMPELEFYE